MARTREGARGIRAILWRMRPGTTTEVALEPAEEPLEALVQAVAGGDRGALEDVKRRPNMHQMALT